MELILIKSNIYIDSFHSNYMVSYSSSRIYLLYNQYYHKDFVQEIKCNDEGGVNTSCRGKEENQAKRVPTIEQKPLRSQISGQCNSENIYRTIITLYSILAYSASPAYQQRGNERVLYKKVTRLHFKQEWEPFKLHCVFLFHLANENQAFRTAEYILNTQQHYMSYKENRPKNTQRIKEMSLRNFAATVCGLQCFLSLIQTQHYFYYKTKKVFAQIDWSMSNCFEICN